jgi:chromosome segregation ATPase
LITPAEFEIDISKLRSSIRKCTRSIRKLYAAIEQKREEQKELMALIKNPGPYNVEALKENVERCDVHVKEYEKVIRSERQHIKTYEQIIKVLEMKKCQSEATSPSTGH